MMTLYENPGWGSAIVEAQIAFYGMHCKLVRVGDLFEDEDARKALQALNPVAQVPTLLLDDGQVMTESAAITLFLADLAGSTALVPGPGEAERPVFLRWLIFLVAAIYPTFTFGDQPTRYVSEAEATAFRARVDAERMAHWRLMESEMARHMARHGGPWFLGARMSAIDVYLMVMVHWKPGERWFRAEAPKLLAAAKAAAALEIFAPVMQRNVG